MIKQEELLNPNSCLNKAAADEPIFVLRANDPIAADLIAVWSIKYMNEKGGWGKMTPAQQAKFSEALALAKSMKDWRSTTQFTDDVPF